MSIVGRTYLERGEPVEIVVQWSGKPDLGFDYSGNCLITGKGPRNVLIRRANGQLVVRPFRGLRRAP